jgi:mannose-6-phosphate isomerase-like protein (cupin superfamily)
MGEAGGPPIKFNEVPVNLATSCPPGKSQLSRRTGGLVARTARTVSKRNVERFVWREVCEGWRLVDETSLQVIQERMPPATFELRHLHERTHQLYFILEGEATVELDDELFVLEAGDGIEIPASRPHQIRNDSPGDLEFLVVSTGRTREDRTNL